MIITSWAERLLTTVLQGPGLSMQGTVQQGWVCQLRYIMQRFNSFCIL
jgi:hypothetical protein